MTFDSQEPILSVVLPAFNEAGRVSVTIQDAAATFTAIHGDAWELIVVDDGSTDKTVDVVRSLSAMVPSLQLISHVGNLGKGAAVRTGVLDSGPE
ncbi:MAG: glycosyltransferase family 2 protein [Planctomycetota bacterium]|jgi:glycosyltransferase involved in cell wall biosynthesis|nr:MAG: glycosyltransferase family 2 protein [Planctomycetota bacterium]